MAHKDSLAKKTMTSVHGKLYFFVSQLLLERISWICRDGHQRYPSGNGSAAIVFSQRTSLNYREFQAYAREIREGSSKYPSKAAWGHVDVDHVYSVPHARSCDGLLIADHIASAYGNAVERNRYGFCDDHAVRLLARNCYHHIGEDGKHGKRWKNGLKLYPPEAESRLPSSDERLWWLKNHYDHP